MLPAQQFTKKVLFLCLVSANGVLRLDRYDHWPFNRIVSEQGIELWVVKLKIDHKRVGQKVMVLLACLILR